MVLNENSTETLADISVGASKVIINDGVLQIPQSTFENKEIIEIEVPSSLEIIEIKSFRGGFEEYYWGEIDKFNNKTNLKSIDLSNTNLTHLGGYSFEGSNLEEIILPEKEFELGVRVFRASNLKTIDMSKTKIEKIPFATFAKCENLTSVQLSPDTRLIDEAAFKECHNLSNIIIPSSCKKIGKEAFKYCSITNLSFEKNSKIEIIGESAFQYNRLSSSLTIPNTVKEIGANAFDYFEGVPAAGVLKFLTFESNSQLIKIGPGAFQGRYGLSGELVFPASLKEIGDRAFWAPTANEERKLTKIIFPKNSQLESIGASAFKDWTSLKEVYLPASVKTIDPSAFENCRGIEKIYIDKPENSIEKSTWGANNSTIIWRGGNK